MVSHRVLFYVPFCSPIMSSPLLISKHNSTRPVCNLSSILLFCSVHHYINFMYAYIQYILYARQLFGSSDDSVLILRFSCSIIPGSQARVQVICFWSYQAVLTEIFKCK